MIRPVFIALWLLAVALLAIAICTPASAQFEKIPSFIHRIEKLEMRVGITDPHVYHGVVINEPQGGVLVPTLREMEELRTRIAAIEEALRKLSEAITPPVVPDPVDPTDPTEPTEPEEPEEPEEPTDPVDPTDPEEPTDPVDPTEPDEPDPVDPDPIPVPDGVLDPAQLQFVGGYRIPAAMLGARSMAFSHCGLTGRGETIWMPHHTHTGAVAEFRRPVGRGTDKGSRHLWPQASHIRNIANAYSELKSFNFQIEVFGVHWSPELDRLLVSGRDIYAAGAQKAEWLVAVDVSQSPAVVEPAINPGPFPSRQFGGGFVTIPQAFADEYTGGNTIGLSHGGYNSGQGSSHSPTLAAWGDAPSKLLMLSPWQAPRQDREQRDDNYSGESGVWVLPPIDGVGVWGTDRVLGTAWVHTSEASAFVALVLQPTGAFNYALQNEVLSDGNQLRLYVYDPADFAKVAKGELSPAGVRGTWHEVPRIGGGRPNGLWWDAERKLLNIVYRGAWKQFPSATESYPIVAEYEIQTGVN